MPGYSVRWGTSWPGPANTRRQRNVSLRSWRRNPPTQTPGTGEARCSRGLAGMPMRRKPTHERWTGTQKTLSCRKNSRGPLRGPAPTGKQRPALREFFGRTLKAPVRSQGRGPPSCTAGIIPVPLTRLTGCLPGTRITWMPSTAKHGRSSTSAASRRLPTVTGRSPPPIPGTPPPCTTRARSSSVRVGMRGRSSASIRSSSPTPIIWQHATPWAWSTIRSAATTGRSRVLTIS